MAPSSVASQPQPPEPHRRSKRFVHHKQLPTLPIDQASPTTSSFPHGTAPPHTSRPLPAAARSPSRGVPATEPSHIRPTNRDNRTKQRDRRPSNTALAAATSKPLPVDPLFDPNDDHDLLTDLRGHSIAVVDDGASHDPFAFSEAMGTNNALHGSIAGSSVLHSFGRLSSVIDMSGIDLGNVPRRRGSSTANDEVEHYDHDVSPYYVSQTYSTGNGSENQSTGGLAAVQHKQQQHVAATSATPATQNVFMNDTAGIDAHSRQLSRISVMLLQMDDAITQSSRPPRRKGSRGDMDQYSSDVGSDDDVNADNSIRLKLDETKRKSMAMFAAHGAYKYLDKKHPLTQTQLKSKLQTNRKNESEKSSRLGQTGMQQQRTAPRADHMRNVEVFNDEESQSESDAENSVLSSSSSSDANDISGTAMKPTGSKAKRNSLAYTSDEESFSNDEDECKSVEVESVFENSDLSDSFSSDNVLAQSGKGRKRSTTSKSENADSPQKQETSDSDRSSVFMLKKPSNTTLFVPPSDMKINENPYFLQIHDPKKRLSCRVSINFGLPSNVGNASGIVVGGNNQQTFVESDSFVLDSRVLINHGHVWQVISSSTVKDRYMLLFNDLLVLTKPSGKNNKTMNWNSFKKMAVSGKSDQDVIESLRNSKFVVKSVHDIDNLKINTRDERWQYEYKPPSKEMIEGFKLFSQNPTRAVFQLMNTSQLPCTPIAVALFLHTFPMLSRSKIGHFLSSPSHVDILESFLHVFPFKNMLLCQAYRLFLGTVQLPKTAAGIEHILTYFSKAWNSRNRDTVQFSEKTTLKLILSAMELNADIHLGVQSVGGIPSSQMFVQRFIRYLRQDGAICNEIRTRLGISASVPNGSLTLDDFGLTEGFLYAVYNNVKRESLEISSGPSRSKLSITVQVEPRFITSCIRDGRKGYSRYGLRKAAFMTRPSEDIPAGDRELAAALTPLPFPTRLVAKERSCSVLVEIPAPDAQLSIRLHGAGLVFEPPVLTFARSNVARFTMIASGASSSSTTTTSSSTSQTGSNTPSSGTTATPATSSSGGNGGGRTGGIGGGSPGRRPVFFERCGPTAPKYEAPRARLVTVEPGFLQHSFEVVAGRERVLVVVPNSEVRGTWLTRFEDLGVEPDAV